MSLRRHFSHFQRDNHPEPSGVVEATWEELTASLREPVPKASKSELPLWSPARFHRGKKEKDVISVSLLGYDGDQDDSLSPEILSERLQGYRFFAHTSANSKPGTWRWRILIDTEREMTPDEYRATWEAVRGRLGFAVGTNTGNPNRCWYYPCGEPVFVEGGGIPVPISPPAPKVPALANPKIISGGSIDPEQLGRHWADKGERNDAYLCVYGILAREGKTLEEIEKISLRISELAGDEEAQQRLTSIPLSIERVAEEDPAYGWPKLRKLLPAEAFKNEIAERAIDAVTGKKSPKDPIFGGWDTPPEPVIYLVDGLITPGSVNMFAAHGGSLKTWAALTMALSVVRKEPWLGRVANKGKAIIVDYESGRTEVHRRIALLGAHDTEDLGYVWPDTTADRPEFWDVLPPCALVIVDSLAAGTPSLDENKKEAALPLLMARHYAERTGAAVIFIHHVGKGEKRDMREMLRGSSALLAALDTAYVFGAPEGPKEDKTSLMACIKARRGVQPDPFEFRILFSRDGARIQTSEPRTKDLRTDESLCASIRLQIASGLCTIQGMSTRLGVRRQRVADAIRTLVERGELRDTGKGYEQDSYELRKARVLPLLESRLSVAELARAARIDKTLLVEEFQGKVFEHDKRQGCHGIGE